MSKTKQQKSEDLQELSGKLKKAKSIVLTDYRGTTVKDMDKLRKALRKESVFSKVYKLTLVEKALEQSGLESKDLSYKTPVLISVSEDEEPVAARVIKNLSKEIKTISILEGIMEGKFISKLQVEALADLPSKDQLRAQFMSVLNSPISAFARVIKAYGDKLAIQVSNSPAAAETKISEPAPASAEAVSVAA